MTKTAIIFCIFILCLWAAAVVSADANSVAGKDVNLPGCEANIMTTCRKLTIFITGNELGELRPCGCSSGQLGGFDRRGTLFNTVPPQQRIILDTGNFLKEQTEQSLLKLDIMMQAFTWLGYDVVGLSKKDLDVAINRGLIDTTSFKFIAAQSLPQVFSKQMELGGKAVTMTVAVADTEESSIQKAAGEFEKLSSANAIKIVIFDGGEDEVKKHLDELAADVVIVRTNSDEPEVLTKTDKGLLVVSAGRLGKYVGRLDVKRTKSPDRFEMEYKSLPVDANLAQVPLFIDLYKTYQATVKEQKLLEKYPKFGLPKGLRYVGSQACGLKGCHDYEYKTAIGANHEKKAFDSLVLAGSDYDPECVKCHVVGMEYQSGFVTEIKTPDLKDVGCESCHGPGSEHIVTAGKAKTTGPQVKCVDCHTAEQSVNYAGHEKEYEKKIIHWREPNALRIVK